MRSVSRRRIGVVANMIRARRHAANARLVISAIQLSGITKNSAIADALNLRGIATARGDHWSAESVGRVLLIASDV